MKIRRVGRVAILGQGGRVLAQADGVPYSVHMNGSVDLEQDLDLTFSQSGVIAAVRIGSGSRPWVGNTDKAVTGGPVKLQA
jgi:hypothetical protein